MWYPLSWFVLFFLSYHRIWNICQYLYHLFLCSFQSCVCIKLSYKAGDLFCMWGLTPILTKKTACSPVHTMLWHAPVWLVPTTTFILASCVSINSKHHQIKALTVQLECTYVNWRTCCSIFLFSCPGVKPLRACSNHSHTILDKSLIIFRHDHLVCSLYSYVMSDCSLKSQALYLQLFWFSTKRFPHKWREHIKTSSFDATKLFLLRVSHQYFQEYLAMFTIKNWKCPLPFKYL